MPYQLYVAGNVLTATQMNTLHRQSVMTFASSAARDSALSGVLDEGMVAYLEDTDSLTVYSGSAWYTVGPLGAWTSYTPTLTASSSNPTLGSGSSATGSWNRNGRSIDFRANITFGSSGTAAGSGSYRVSLPVPAASAWFGMPIGMANLNDSGTAYYRFVIVGADGTYVDLFTENGTGVSNSVPFAWSSSDFLRVSGTYEAGS